MQTLSRSKADDKEQLDAVDEQLARMNQIVSYQLQRAVQTNNRSALARQVQVKPVAEKVLDALAKVYRRQVGVVSQISWTRRCVLLETSVICWRCSAMFWIMRSSTAGEVSIRASVENHDSSGLQIVIEDNGPGISIEKQEYVLQRGARADT